MPVASLLETMLGAPAIMVPMGQVRATGGLQRHVRLLYCRGVPAGSQGHKRWHAPSPPPLPLPLLLPLQSSDSCHLANERIRRSNLLRGKAVIRRLLEEVALSATTPGGGGGEQAQGQGHKCDGC